MIARPPTPAPTPIPAFAPSERPVEELSADGEPDGDVDGVEVEVEVEEPKFAAIVIALSELQHSVLLKPQHQVSDVGVPSQEVILIVLLPLPSLFSLISQQEHNIDLRTGKDSSSCHIICADTQAPITPI